VLQVTESLNVRFGGIATAYAQLVNHLACAGVEVIALTVDPEAGDAGRVPLESRVRAMACRPSRPRRLGYCAGMAKRLDTAPVPAVVHIHGLWRLHAAQVIRYAQRIGAPVVISPHGMLHAAARRQRAIVKRAARRLFQDAVLRRARCLHATAAEEADEIRRLGFDGPIAVIPWGVEAPPARAARADAASVASPDSRVVLFLGRFHPTKGLDVLLRAWALAHRRFPSSRLVLAGYDEADYRRRLVALAASLGVSASTTFAGPVEGAAREALFADASVLVLPSPAENFGFVVPEALVRGIPVITTEGTPWSALAAEACGWWIPAGEEPLAAAISAALDQSPDALRAMGDRGRAFARTRFDWDRVSAAMIELYEWTRGNAPEPAFVQR
jgi:glycosyltransferase involved in cell wall biosynthesis